MKLKSYQAGVALILCLALMAVFFAMAMYVTGKQQQQLALFRGLQEKVELHYEAESVLQLLNFTVTTNSPYERNGRVFELNDYGIPVDIGDGIQISINNGYGVLSMVPFDQDAFSALVDSVTQETGAGPKLVDKILDWQDSDNYERLNGKEASNVDDVSYQPRNYTMQSLSELKLIDGVTDELYRLLEPHLIYYKIAPFDTNAASPELRRLLGLDELERKGNIYTQINGLNIGLQQPLVLDIKVKGEYASLSQRYYIRYWPTANELWGYSEYGE